MDRLPQEITSFSTARVRGPNKVCQCGKSFVSTRAFVKWCSNDCRKRFYQDHRAIVKGNWSAVRKAKNRTLGSHTRWQWISKLKAMNFACYWCGVIMKRHEATKEHLTRYLVVEPMALKTSCLHVGHVIGKRTLKQLLNFGSTKSVFHKSTRSLLRLVII
jgi:hypothetical protein